MPDARLSSAGTQKDSLLAMYTSGLHTTRTDTTQTQNYNYFIPRPN
jgi:hypothetical protein